MPSEQATVTLVFVDIERSTRLVQRLGPGYGELLARFRALGKSTIEAQGGRVVDAQGDGLFLVTPTAPAAAAATAEIQRQLDRARWALEAEVRARAGIHTGSPSPLGEGYFGIDVHRAARICSAANGGQVLLSAPTAELLSQADGFEVKPLGPHRLRDLASDFRLFQLVVEGVPAVDLPPRAGRTGAANLPPPPTDLIGREQEVGAVIALVHQGARLLTVTGAPGVGKTRVALEAAAYLAEEFEDGVYFVDLSGLADPTLLSALIAESLSVPDASGPLPEALFDALRERRALLLLDSFERLRAAAQLVQRLLDECRSISILVTSRAPLRLSSERLYPLAPLAVPWGEDDPDEILSYDSVRLFLSRAYAFRPQLELDSSSVLAVAQICMRLDGLPLAIELAAPRTRLLSPEAILARLDDRFPLLSHGARDAPPRQQTLESALLWSYELLDAFDRELFCALGLFEGPIFLEPAEIVAGVGGPELVDGLQRLKEEGLLASIESADPRFYVLESVRKFAQDRLREQDDGDEVRGRFVEHYTVVAGRGAEALRGPEQADWLGFLDYEQPNFRAALYDGVQMHPDAALSLATSLTRYWYRRGFFAEGARWLGLALDAAEGAPAGAQARARVALGLLALEQGDYGEAGTQLEHGRSLADEAGEPGVEFEALNNLAALQLLQADLDAAAEILDEAAELARTLDDVHALASCKSNAGYLDLAAGRLDDAQENFEEALHLVGQTGDLDRVAAAFTNLGRAALAAFEWRSAADYFDASLRTFADLGHRVGDVAQSLEGLAEACARLGRAREGAVLLGAAYTMRRELGLPIAPIDQPFYAASRSAVEAELTAEELDEAWAEGASFGPDAALAFAAAIELPAGAAGGR